MSPEMYMIASAAIGLAALMMRLEIITRRALAELRQDLNDLRKKQNSFRAEFTQKLDDLRTEFTQNLDGLRTEQNSLRTDAERVARIEGAIVGPRDFAPGAGTGATA